MLGLGKWTGDIETSVMSGSAVVEIKDNNGEYDFAVSKMFPIFRFTM